MAWLDYEVSVPVWVLLILAAIAVLDWYRLRITTRQCEQAIALAQEAIDQLPDKK